MIQFYSPWFALLLILPFLIKPKKEVLELHFPALERLKKAFPYSHHQKKDPFFILLYLSWALFTLALMQPEKVDQWNTLKNTGYDLMVAVDVSGSMQALDLSTTKMITRLDAAKEVVSRFVLGRQGDRVGLITFGQNAYLHVPLTLDTLSVSRMLNETLIGMAGNGTAIGDAMGLAIRTLKDKKEGSRVLILLTDGEDNSSTLPPLEAAKLAKQYGIKIYTVGIGEQNEELNEIAMMTGGQFYHASNQKTLERIYQQIDTLEKTEAEESIHKLREPLYAYPLSLAALLLLFLNMRRNFGF